MAKVRTFSINTIVDTIPGFRRPFSVTITPDGEKAVVANFQDDTVSVVDITVTPLMLAARNGNLQQVQTLIMGGANVNAVDLSGNTPLMWAVRGGNGAIVLALLDRGANPYARNHNGQTALDIAIASNNPELIRLLESYRNAVLGGLMKKGLPPEVVGQIFGYAFGSRNPKQLNPNYVRE